MLRVNVRNYEESFIDNPLGDSEQDILILGMHNRNRALHGDHVVVRIKDREHWIVSNFNLFQGVMEHHLRAISVQEIHEDKVILKVDQPILMGWGFFSPYKLIICFELLQYS